MWEPRRLTTMWASTACYRNSFTFCNHLLHYYGPENNATPSFLRSIIKNISSTIVRANMALKSPPRWFFIVIGSLVFSIYLTTLTVARNLWCRMAGWLVDKDLEKEAEGNDRSLISGTIVEFVWRDWGTPRKPSRHSVPGPREYKWRASSSRLLTLAISVSCPAARPYRDCPRAKN
jgi:hypothetical protein